MGNWWEAYGIDTNEINAMAGITYGENNVTIPQIKIGEDINIETVRQAYQEGALEEQTLQQADEKDTSEEKNTTIEGWKVRKKVIDVTYLEWLDSSPFIKELGDVLSTPPLTTSGTRIKFGYIGKDGKRHSLDEASPKVIECEYILKNSILKDMFNLQEVEAVDFYNDLYTYPNYIDNSKNAIVYLNRTPGLKKHTYKFEDGCLDFLSLSEYISMYAVDIYSPNKTGRPVSNTSISNVFALVVDVDSVLAGDLYEHLANDWVACKNSSRFERLLLKPTYIVNSGTGLHLYYLFDQPVPFTKHHKNELRQLNYKLQLDYNSCTDKNGEWTYVDRYLCTRPQHHTDITLGYRIVGGLTKQGSKVRAFKYGPRYTFTDLLIYYGIERESIKEEIYKKKKLQHNREYRLKMLENIIPKHSKDIAKDMRFLVKNVASAYYSSNDVRYDVDGAIEAARKVYTTYKSIHKTDDNPSKFDWYIISLESEYNKIKSSTYINNSELSFNLEETIKKDKQHTVKGLYIWARNNLTNDIPVGYRYHALRALGGFAYKCGIPKDQFISDAKDIYEGIKLRIRVRKDVDFTDDDFSASLKFYDFCYKKRLNFSNKYLIALAPEAFPSFKTEAQKAQERAAIQQRKTKREERKALEKQKKAQEAQEKAAIKSNKIVGIMNRMLHDIETIIYFGYLCSIGVNNIKPKQINKKAKSGCINYMYKILDVYVFDRPSDGAWCVNIPTVSELIKHINKEDKASARRTYEKYYSEVIKHLKTSLEQMCGQEDLIYFGKGENRGSIYINYIPAIPNDLDKLRACITSNILTVREQAIACNLSRNKIINLRHQLEELEQS